MRIRFHFIYIVMVCTLVVSCGQPFIDGDAARLQISGGDFFVAVPQQQSSVTLCSVVNDGFKSNCRSQLESDIYDQYPDDAAPPGKQTALIRTDDVIYEISRYRLSGPSKVAVGGATTIIGTQFNGTLATPISKGIELGDSTFYFEPAPDTVFVLGLTRVSDGKASFEAASTEEAEALRAALLSAQGDKARKLKVTSVETRQINCVLDGRKQFCSIGSLP